MNDTQKIRSVVARFFQVPEASVTDDFVFPRERMQGSAARFTFHAALKRMAGADLTTAHTAETLADLLSQSSAVAAPTLGAIATGVRQELNGFAKKQFAETLQVGIDVEEVDNLPWSGDPWSDPFYLENFTDAEIAHCLRRPEPKVSFCGLWAAKEAALKCCGKIPGFRPKQMEISHDASGQPSLNAQDWPEPSGSNRPALSISHTGLTAIAICIHLQTPDAPAPQTLEPEGTESRPAKPGVAAAAIAWIALLLALLSVGISLFAFIHR